MTASRRTAHSPLLNHDAIGLEARVVSDDHQSLKLWLRLLSCSTQIETALAKRLRQEAGITLARFDFLAQLHRHPDGLTMSVLSRYLMVTGGNVTGLADELEKEGLVERLADPNDRRTSHVSLTKKGRRRFDTLATAHEAWLVTMFGGMSTHDMRQLYELLGRLRIQLAAQQLQATPASPPKASRSSRPSTVARRTPRTGART